MPLISSPAGVLQGLFDLALVRMDKVQRLSLNFIISWMTIWKRIVSNRKLCSIISNEAPTWCHFPFNFSFIIYSILETNYLQDEKERLKNPPTLPLPAHCLISCCPSGISCCIFAVFLKWKHPNPNWSFSPIPWSSHLTFSSDASSVVRPQYSKLQTCK